MTEDIKMFIGMFGLGTFLMLCFLMGNGIFFNQTKVILKYLTLLILIIITLDYSKVFFYNPLKLTLNVSFTTS